MDIIKNIIYTNKNDILDPLSVIMKLFIYHFKPPGTKISIGNNRIVLQENNFLQGTVRKIYGDCKNDINILYGPILYACIKYLHSDIRTKYIYIFETVSNSLNKLKLTYAGNEIVYNIDQIKNIIDSFIKNNENDINIIIANYNNNHSFKIKQNIYEHLNEVWKPERKKILMGFVDEIKNFTSLEYESAIIESLSSFLYCMDMNTKNIINNI